MYSDKSGNAFIQVVGTYGEWNIYFVNCIDLGFFKDSKWVLAMNLKTLPTDTNLVNQIYRS